MNVLILLIIAVILFVLASRFYSRYISKELGEDVNRPTPSVTMTDGRDYVPTKVHILFAHHFSAIAGAGPILGPTMAVLYGAVPACLWIVIGGIFIGAVHDYTALFVSVREKGRSMAEIARTTLGQKGFALFILFTLIMIVLVTSAFLVATATSLTSQWPVEKLGLSEGQTFLRTVTGDDGVKRGVIGGIASTSVVIITLFSPILGYLIYKRKMSLVIAYPLAAIVCFVSVVAGVYYPISFPPDVWMIILSIYVLLAAGMPVWFILQPRDFINVQILYAGVLVLVSALFIGGIGGMSLSIPAFNVEEGTQKLGLIWPMLFITIACGAISGFHGMVAGGTTAKQVSSERDVRRIGYNAMLLEALLALCVVLAVGACLSFNDYKSIVWTTAKDMKSNPILAFSLAIGGLTNKTLHIPMAVGTVFGILLVEGFVITTLDAAVRLNRYLFEELWGIIFKKPGALLRQFWFNAGLSVVLMWLLAYKNAFSTLWPIFGTGNQLLAALSLIAISAWLFTRGKKCWFTLIPAVFMFVTTIAALIILLRKYIDQKADTLIAADILLLCLSVAVVIISLFAYGKMKGKAVTG